jgi:hypothetical protein
VRRSVGGAHLSVGFSLGGAVAAISPSIGLSQTLILVKPFDSCEAAARDLFWSAPVGPLLRNRMPTIEVVCGSNVPTALITARRDTIVPNRCSVRLRAAIKNSVFSPIDVVHIDLCDHPDFAKAAREALRVEATSGESLDAHGSNLTLVLIRIVDGRNQPQFCRFLYSEIASGPTASEAICERVKSTHSCRSNSYR